MHYGITELVSKHGTKVIEHYTEAQLAETCYWAVEYLIESNHKGQERVAEQTAATIYKYARDKYPAFDDALNKVIAIYASWK